MLGSRLTDRYEILAELGRGGMGVVYRAQDPLLNRQVAIKLIPPAQLSPDAESRFRAEAQVVAQMDHPSIVPIFDLGIHDGSMFFVMPVVEGKSLRWLLKQGALTLGDILSIGIQTAEALDYSHARGVVHRDIKPENLMIVREGDDLRVRVMDFGLARVSSDVTGITKTGTLIGTMGYLSPEQVTSHQVGPASDLYSLGTVLYECITGALPFSGELQSILYRIVHEQPDPPHKRGATIDESLESIVLATLSKGPDDRPASGAALATLLREYRAGMRDSEHTRTIRMESTQVQRPALSPFVGRKEELKELQHRLNAAVAGECQLVVLGGEQGVGKTRLLDELESLARARKIPVLHGRFLEQDQSFPYHGFYEAIQEYFRHRESTSSSSELPDFSDLEADLTALFPMLSEVDAFRTRSSSHKSPTPSPATRIENRTEIFEILARTLTRLASGRALAIFFEDLHAADVSIEALQYVIRRLGAAPILFVGTFRSNEVDRSHALTGMLGSFRGDRRFAELMLAQLTVSEHEQFVRTLVGGKDIETELARKLFEGSEGNPFFTKELVRSLLESGGISQMATGAWTLSDDSELSVENMPATIQQAVEKRIENLPDSHRDVLSVASVIGKSFDFRDLEQLARDVEDLDDVVDALVQDGLLEEDRKARGDRLAFTSGVVRDVLYGGLARRKRRTLHRRIGELLEKRHASRLERVMPDLLTHFSEGDVPEKAVDYGLQLARRALEAFSPEEAIRAGKLALEFVDEEWEGDATVEADIRTLLARGQQLLGDFGAALREVEPAIRILQQSGQTDRVTECYVQAARLSWAAREGETTTRFLERGLELARETGNVDALRELLELSVSISNLRGEYEHANRRQEELEGLGNVGPAPAATEEMPQGGHLRVAMSNRVSAVDLADIRYDEEAEALSNFAETLLSMDERGNLVPLLCERWEARDQGRSFVFRIAETARFHDGTPVTAASVKACFEETVRRYRGRIPPVFAGIEGADAFREGNAADIAGLRVDSRGELEIRLVEPLPIYPAHLTGVTSAVVKAGEDDDPSGARLIGTGPFLVKDRTSSGDVVLLRNDSYWRGARPNIEGITFVSGLAGADVADGLRDGTLDLGRNLPASMLEEMARDPRFRDRIVEITGRNTSMIVFNCLTGPTACHAAVRRALSGVLRVRDLVWQTSGRIAEPAVCLISPGMIGHDPGRRRPVLDKDEARELLRSAGDGKPIRLRVGITPATRDRSGALVEAIFSIWKEIGAEVEIVTDSRESVAEKVENPEGVDALVGGWIPDYHDPDSFTHDLFDSKTGLYRGLYCSPEADAILQKARSDSRPSVREGLYRQFEGLLRDADVAIPLAHDLDYRMPGPRVRGLRLRGALPYVNYGEMGVADADEVPRRPEPAAAASGTIRVSMLGGSLTAADPARLSFVTDGEVLSNIFEQLTRAQGGARIVPWLAREYSVENGGLRFRVRLHDDIRFHDGRRLTARDVRYTFERVLQDENCEHSWCLAPIRGATALQAGEAEGLEGFQIQSATEFTLELDKPSAFLPAALSHQGLGIVPEGFHEPGSSWQEGAVGTGPFRVARFERTRIALERHPRYWRPGYPRSQSLIFDAAKTPEEIRAGFENGHYSLVEGLTEPDIEALRRDPAYRSCYRESPSLTLSYFAMNPRTSVTSDPAVRARVRDAIDREEVAAAAGAVSNAVANGVIPPGLVGYEAQPPVFRTDPGAGDGPPDEIELRVASPPTYRKSHAHMVNALRNCLKRAGVKLRFVTSSSAEYAAALGSGDSVDAVLGGWGADFPDAHAMVHGLVHSQGELGRILGAPELDALIERAQVEGDVRARHACYREAEEYIARNALVVPLTHMNIYRFVRPEIEGLELSYSGPYVDYARLRHRGTGGLPAPGSPERTPGSRRG